MGQPALYIQETVFHFFLLVSYEFQIPNFFLSFSVLIVSGDYCFTFQVNAAKEGEDTETDEDEIPSEVKGSPAKDKRKLEEYESDEDNQGEHIRQCGVDTVQAKRSKRMFLIVLLQR